MLDKAVLDEDDLISSDRLYFFILFNDD